VQDLVAPPSPPSTGQSREQRLEEALFRHAGWYHNLAQSTIQPEAAKHMGLNFTTCEVSACLAVRRALESKPGPGQDVEAQARALAEQIVAPIHHDMHDYYGCAVYDGPASKRYGQGCTCGEESRYAADITEAVALIASALRAAQAEAAEAAQEHVRILQREHDAQRAARVAAERRAQEAEARLAEREKE
jgi:hypothetical protein